jgi:hypothetical protein
MSTATVTTDGSTKTSETGKQPHNLVWQLRKAREEWAIIFEGVSDEDGFRRVGRMNSLGWMMAHLAWHEQLVYALMTGKMIAPTLNEIAPTGGPVTTPRLSEMTSLWQQVTSETDAYFATLTLEDLRGHLEFNGDTFPECIGAIFQRINNHYFYHIGEASAIRQMLEHPDIPDIMAEFGSVTYHPELR